MSKLTVKFVEKKIREGNKSLIGDGQGLYLKISAPGRASWVYRYKIEGKTRDMGIGKYPEVGLAEAREIALDARRTRSAGLDPLAERVAKQLREAEAIRAEAIIAQTFEQLARQYIASHSEGWKNAKHRQQWRNTLATYAFPIIGGIPPQGIETSHVLEILRPIWQVKTETASRVRNRIELVLDYAKALGFRTGENPARWRGHLDKLLPKRSKVAIVKHHAALPWQQLPGLVQTLRKREGYSDKALLMTILTACRTSEVVNAKWSEFDEETRTWTIPAARMKAGKEHRVPLSTQMMTLLRTLPSQAESEYLFPGLKKGKPLSNMAMAMALRRLGLNDITVHGFRSTFRDWAGECTAHPRDVCEQALAHTLGNQVEIAYRRGDLLAKRRLLMEDWGSFAFDCSPASSQRPLLVEVPKRAIA